MALVLLIFAKQGLSSCSEGWYNTSEACSPIICPPYNFEYLDAYASLSGQHFAIGEQDCVPGTDSALCDFTCDEGFAVVGDTTGQETVAFECQSGYDDARAYATTAVPPACSKATCAGSCGRDDLQDCDAGTGTTLCSCASTCGGDLYHRCCDDYATECDGNEARDKGLPGLTGRWVQTDAKSCVAISCPTMMVTDGFTSGACDGAFDDECTFDGCTPGFAPAASGASPGDVFQCKLGGYIGSGPMPACVPIDCGKLRLDHGEVTGDCDGAEGDQCQYLRCDSGYILEPADPPIRTCAGGGTELAAWSNTSASCVEDISGKWGVCTSTGDPHFRTFDNQRHHFQGRGFFYLMKAPGVGVQVEQVAWHRRRNRLRGPAVNIAMAIGGTDTGGATLELYAGSPPRLIVNGISVISEDDQHAYESGTQQAGSLTFTSANPRKLDVTLETGLRIQVRAYSILNIAIQIPPSYRPQVNKLAPMSEGGICGLCGDFDNDPTNDWGTNNKNFSDGCGGSVIRVNPEDCLFETEAPTCCSGEDCPIVTSTTSTTITTTTTTLGGGATVTVPSDLPSDIFVGPNGFDPEVDPACLYAFYYADAYGDSNVPDDCTDQGGSPCDRLHEEWVNFIQGYCTSSLDVPIATIPSQDDCVSDACGIIVAEGDAAHENGDTLTPEEALDLIFAAGIANDDAVIVEATAEADLRSAERCPDLLRSSGIQEWRCENTTIGSTCTYPPCPTGWSSGPGLVERTCTLPSSPAQDTTFLGIWSGHPVMCIKDANSPTITPAVASNELPNAAVGAALILSVEVYVPREKNVAIKVQLSGSLTSTIVLEAPSVVHAGAFVETAIPIISGGVATIEVSNIAHVIDGVAPDAGGIAEDLLQLQLSFIPEKPMESMTDLQVAVEMFQDSSLLHTSKPVIFDILPKLPTLILEGVAPLAGELGSFADFALSIKNPGDLAVLRVTVICVGEAYTDTSSATKNAQSVGTLTTNTEDITFSDLPSLEPGEEMDLKWSIESPIGVPPESPIGFVDCTATFYSTPSEGSPINSEPLVLTLLSKPVQIVQRALSDVVSFDGLLKTTEVFFDLAIPANSFDPVLTLNVSLEPSNLLNIVNVRFDNLTSTGTTTVGNVDFTADNKVRRVRRSNGVGAPSGVINITSLSGGATGGVASIGVTLARTSNSGGGTVTLSSGGTGLAYLAVAPSSTTSSSSSSISAGAVVGIVIAIAVLICIVAAVLYHQRRSKGKSSMPALSIDRKLSTEPNALEAAIYSRPTADFALDADDSLRFKSVHRSNPLADGRGRRLSRTASYGDALDELEPELGGWDAGVVKWNEGDRLEGIDYVPVSTATATVAVATAGSRDRGTYLDME